MPDLHRLSEEDTGGETRTHTHTRTQIEIHLKKLEYCEKGQYFLY